MYLEPEAVRVSRLPNGILLLTEAMPGLASVSIGVWTDAGSEEEGDGEYGQAHFLEHMLFKGTTTHNAFELAEMIENVGGQLNAYTERETTNVYVRTLAEHLPLAVGLMAEMVCHSTFDPAEMERERQVIVEEILKYDSLPEDRITDLFMAALWHEGTLGHPILGTEPSVRALTREQIVQCWRRHFAAERVMITAAGALDHDQLAALVFEAFVDLPPQAPVCPALPEGTILPRCIEEEDGEQVNFCWGTRTFPAHDDRNFPLALLDTILGASTTSRLFQEIREKRGLAYDVTSYTQGFRNAGMLCASGACAPETFPEVLTLMAQELRSLRRIGVSVEEVARAKEQLKVGLALSLEGTQDRMRRLAMHQLTWGEVYSIGALIDRIQRVTREEIMALSEALLDPRSWSFAAIGPIADAQVADLLASTTVSSITEG